MRHIDGSAHYVLYENGVIIIETSSDAMTIHEITHIVQSWFSGGLEFNQAGLLKNAATKMKAGKEVKADALINNEVEAYQRQYSYDKSFPISGIRLFGIDKEAIRRIKDVNGIFVYPF